MAITRSLKAIEDLEEISDYLAQFSLPAATRFLNSADATFRQLERFPRLGRPCRFRDPSLAGVRRRLVHNTNQYMVYYRPIEDGVEIVRVLNVARDVRRLLGRELDDE